MAKSDLRKTIKRDLLDQLERNGTCGSYYRDLVEDYMNFWDIKNDLISDIKARGPVVEYVSNTGQRNMKKNESVDSLQKVSKRMTELLDSLGINPSQADTGDDEM
jgi:phage terminase small subunit